MACLNLNATQAALKGWPEPAGCALACSVVGLNKVKIVASLKPEMHIPHVRAGTPPKPQGGGGAEGTGTGTVLASPVALPAVPHP